MEYVPIVISVLSLIFAFYTYAKKANADSASEMTTVIVKLENIGSGIADIKAEIASLKNDQKDDHDKLIKVETSLSSAWKRINELGGIKNDNE